MRDISLELAQIKPVSHLNQILSPVNHPHFEEISSAQPEMSQAVPLSSSGSDSRETIARSSPHV